MLDKEDSRIDPSQYQIPEIEISADVTDLDIEDIGDDKVEQLKKKYINAVAQDVETISNDE